MIAPQLRSALAGVAALAALASTPAVGHRGHDAMSSVTIEKDGRVLVSHRLEASDIEPALAIIAPDAQPSLDDPEAVAVLTAYLGNRFQLAGDGRPIALVSAGSDLGSAVAEFRFIGRARLPVKQLTVSSAILTDVHAAQVNQVLVRRGTSVQSLVLRGASSQILPIAQSK